MRRLRLFRALVPIAVLMAVAIGAGLSPTQAGAVTPPTITSFSPSIGVPGQVVAIIGTGFTSTATVDFANSLLATKTYVSPTRLNATVPNGATSGLISVKTAAGTAYSATSFTVLPNPAITVTGTSGYAPSPSGPPTSKVTVSGKGFGGAERVDLYFDTTDMALAVTNTGGGFSAISFAVPSSAQPGQHWITADSQRTQYSAQQSFTVQTNWAEEGIQNTRPALQPLREHAQHGLRPRARS